MNVNLVEALLAQITPSAVSHVAESTAETPTKARAALNAGALAIFMNVVRRGATRAGAAAMLPSLTSSTATATDLAPALLGDQLDPVRDAVMRSSGVSRSTASSATAAMLPLAAGVIGHEVTSRGLDADGLVDLLKTQRTLLVSRPDLPTPTLPPVVRTKSEHVPSEFRPRRLPLVVAIVFGIMLVTIFAARFTRPPRPANDRASETTVTGAPARPASMDDVAALFAGNESLPASVALPAVTFHVGSAELDTSGADTIERLAALMSEHPEARVRLDGHSDAMPGSELGEKLSLQRAAAIRQKLVDRGIDEGRIDIASTHESRAPYGPGQGRGIDLVILAR
jgi:hypothetical protein